MVDRSVTFWNCGRYEPLRVVAFLQAEFKTPARTLGWILSDVPDCHVEGRLIDAGSCGLGPPKMVAWKVEINRITQVD
jgi:hypothetical protein